MIASLIREYGSTPEKWLYETSVEMIAELMDRFAKRVMAEESASASRGRKAVAPRWSSKMQGLKDFRDKVNFIREQWSKADGN